MNLNPIIGALRDRCASLGGRVAGAAKFEVLPVTASLNVPAAYVLPLDDNPESNASGNDYSQTVRDSFAVVVALSNTPDERGQAAITSVHALRAELWKALLGVAPDTDYGPIEYEGGSLLHLDRARLYYQFEFAADFTIGAEDTRQGVELDALGPLSEVYLTVDAIDPTDPNLATPGPDGRAEATAVIPIPQT